MCTYVHGVGAWMYMYTLMCIVPEKKNSTLVILSTQIVAFFLLSCLPIFQNSNNVKNIIKRWEFVYAGKNSSQFCHERLPYHCFNELYIYGSLEILFISLTLFLRQHFRTYS